MTGTLFSDIFFVTNFDSIGTSHGKPKSLGSGGSMVARLKLKGIDGRAPPGVELAA